jgi:hypothetical protein
MLTSIHELNTERRTQKVGFFGFEEIDRVSYLGNIFSEIAKTPNVIPKSILGGQSEDEEGFFYLSFVWIFEKDCIKRACQISRSKFANKYPEWHFLFNELLQKTKFEH